MPHEDTRVLARLGPFTEADWWSAERTDLSSLPSGKNSPPPTIPWPRSRRPARGSSLDDANRCVIPVLEQALQVQNVLAPDDHAKRCDLLLELGDALTFSDPLRAIKEPAEEAFALAESIGDPARARSACRVAIFGLYGYSQGSTMDTPEAIVWVERTDKYSPPETADRVIADFVLSSVQLVQGRWSDVSRAPVRLEPLRS